VRADGKSYDACGKDDVNIFRTDLRGNVRNYDACEMRDINNYDAYLRPGVPFTDAPPIADVKMESDNHALSSYTSDDYKPAVQRICGDADALQVEPIDLSTKHDLQHRNSLSFSRSRSTTDDITTYYKG